MNTLPLDLHVRALLDGRKGDWQAVADGAGVSYSWLSKFFNGHIDNPGFATLTKLRDFLERPAQTSPATQQGA